MRCSRDIPNLEFRVMGAWGWLTGVSLVKRQYKGTEVRYGLSDEDGDAQEPRGLALKVKSKR